MKRLVAWFIVAALVFPSAGYAQAEQAAIDVSKMGVSLDRIRRELAPASSESMTSNGLKLNIRVDVFGQAPPLELVPGDFSLTYGPVPHSAPTHREHIEFVTPRQYRSPAVPIYGVAIWAAQKLAERSKKAQCEQEIADYRAAVMQGIAIVAPRCSQ
jgi:hypothetical protein